MERVKVCLESETIDSVNPRIFLIVSIDTVYGSDAALYDSEVRRFLTSVALKEEDRIKEGVYVPDGIVPVCQGGCLIQEGADNIDIGKRNYQLCNSKNLSDFIDWYSVRFRCSFVCLFIY
jgi:hypothetical protein